MSVTAMRVSDSGVPYGGIVAVARTNHGSSGPELSNLCDTRGLAGRVRYDGWADFEKETRHPRSSARRIARLWKDGMPYGQWIKATFRVFDLNGVVHLQLLVNDALVGETTDENWGTEPCAAGIDPDLPLRADGPRPGSESGQPNLAVYWRSDGVDPDGLLYKDLTVRELEPAQYLRTPSTDGTTGGSTARGPSSSGE